MFQLGINIFFGILDIIFSKIFLQAQVFLIFLC